MALKTSISLRLVDFNTEPIYNALNEDYYNYPRGEGLMTEKKFDPIEITLEATSPSKIETVEAAGKKKVVMVGNLMNSEYNSNHWRVAPEELETVANMVPGSKVKVEHFLGAMNIVGEGTEGGVENGHVTYTDYITDKEAVSKFETGTWTPTNIGVSPKITATKYECSICGRDIRDKPACPHKWRNIYDGQVAKITAKGVTELIEQSITDAPAYKTAGSGTVDFVSALTASLQKFKASEESNMPEKPNDDIQLSATKLLNEKDARIEKLVASQDSLKKEKAELESRLSKELEDTKKELEAKETEYKEKLDKLQTEFKAAKEQIDKAVLGARKVELEKRIADKELVEKIMAKEMTEDEFKTRLEEIDKIKTSARTNEDEGTVPPEDATDEKIKAKVDKIGTELFGSGFKDLMASEDDSGEEGD